MLEGVSCRQRGLIINLLPLSTPLAIPPQSPTLATPPSVHAHAHPTFRSTPPSQLHPLPGASSTCSAAAPGGMRRLCCCGRDCDIPPQDGLHLLSRGMRKIMHMFGEGSRLARRSGEEASSPGDHSVARFVPYACPEAHKPVFSEGVSTNFQNFRPLARWLVSHLIDCLSVSGIVTQYK